MRVSNLLISIFLLFLLSGCDKDEDSSPTASFEISNINPFVGEEVAFTNTSLDANTFIWHFGDGNTSTESNPTHSYTEEGSYVVRLVASSSGKDDSIEKSLNVSIPVNIFPGDRIKDISTDATWGSINNLPGYNFTYLGASGPGNVLKYFSEKSLGLRIHLIGNSSEIYDSDVVTRVEAENSFVGKTIAGISIGSSRSQVENAYGMPDQIGGGSYQDLGIYFAFDASSNVESLFIFSP